MSIRPLHHLCALVALATVGLASFALATTASARSTTPKPTVVLVHGAFADSSGFDGVIDRLAATATVSAPHRTGCHTNARATREPIARRRTPGPRRGADSCFVGERASGWP